MFETTIRILGSLVANHLLAAAGHGGHGWCAVAPPTSPLLLLLLLLLPRRLLLPLHVSQHRRYNNCLLTKAEDMGQRLLAACGTHLFTQ